METKVVLFLALCASTFSVILSLPQVQLAVEPQEPQPQQEVLVAIPNPGETPGAAPVLDASNFPQYRPAPRTFGSLFNLSAYLAGAPNDTASLTFVPLAALLGALG